MTSHLYCLPPDMYPSLPKCIKCPESWLQSRFPGKYVYLFYLLKWTNTGNLLCGLNLSLKITFAAAQSACTHTWAPTCSRAQLLLGAPTVQELQSAEYTSYRHPRQRSHATFHLHPALLWGPKINPRGHMIPQFNTCIQRNIVLSL